MKTVKQTTMAHLIWLSMIFTMNLPSSRFYTNLEKLKNQESPLIQYSVFYTENKGTAQAVKKLATHYGAEALVFKAKPI